jgi:autotransporter-associated beta strand protein
MATVHQIQFTHQIFLHPVVKMKTYPIVKSSPIRLAGPVCHALLLPALCLIAGSGSAATEQWLGVPETSASTNWTDAANWTPGVQQTYYNEVQFTGTGASANTDFSVNNVLDSTTGVAQMPIWQLDFTPLNGNYTTLINPGVTLTTGAGNGTLTVGADILNNSSPAAADAFETITLTGEGGTLNVGGNMYIGQGSTTPRDSHNVTLDLSGLDNFNDTGSLIYVAGGNLQRANGTLYLAKANHISLGNNFQISNQTYSNSVPCAVYLGQANTITIGSGDLTVAGTGTSTVGAWMKFNPAFLGLSPTASFNSSRSNGRIANFNICNANGGPFISGYGLCDFTGGNVTMMVDAMQLGQAGTAGADALGVLTLDNGTVDVNSAVIGKQSSTSGGAGAGIVNLNSNSVAGANATLRVNNTLALAAVTGALTPGSAGTINVNGGTLIANVITNGAGAGEINLANGTMTLYGTAGTQASPISHFIATNSVLNLALMPGTTNLVVTTLTIGGSTNVINILSAPPIASYPVQIPLIKYSGSLAGTGFNFGLGTLPPLYAGHLVNNTINSTIDVLLTAGSSTLTWSGADSGDWDTTTANWTSGGPAIYTDGDFVQFFDGANNNNVNLTTGVLPAATIVSNTTTPFTFTGGGYIDGAGSLLKQGSGTLILDNSGYNVYTGGTTISDGTLQIGNNDANGTLPDGALTDNASLVFARADGPTVNNNISGTGSFTQAGTGGTLVLSGNNTFTGDVLVTNNSTLKLGSSSALGNGSGPVVIANGSTLNINGVYGSRPVVVSGDGVDGNGAITDSGGGVYGFTSMITLTGDTTFGYPNRWDLNNATLSTGGKAYNLTLTGNGYSGSYLEWNNLAIDPALNNINIASVNLGLKGSTSLGDPNGTLVLTPGGALTFYNPNVSINKQVDFQANSTINVGGGDHVMAGMMTLESGYCSFNINSGTSLTLSNNLTGDGTIYLNGGGGSLVLAGNSPSYTGDVALYNGTVMLNGLIGGTLTSQSATTVEGSGIANGLADVSGDLQPGKVGVAGTFHAQGGLTLEGGATLTADLSATTSSGNDLVEVNGDLTLNGNTFNINPTGGGLANGTYTLITYTGNFNGSLGTAMTTFATAYSLVLNNVTTTTPKQIQLIVTGNSQSSQLVWNNASGSGQWDVQSSPNWSNVTAHVSSDVFHYLDSVRFDDSILNAALPETNVVIPSGQIVVPMAITDDSTLNYTISGAGKLSGSTSLTKLGSGTLSLNVPGDFTGPVTIGGGTLQTTGNNTLAAVSSITVSNNSTFDLAGNAYNSTNPIVISGTGANGAGAIYNSAGGIYGEILNIVMANDALISQDGHGRYDLATGSKISGAHNLTINWNGDYGEWNSVNIGTNVSGIILTNGNIGMKYMDTSFQNPATMFTASTNCQVTFWNGGFNGSLNFLGGSSVNDYSNPFGTFNGSSITFGDGVVWLTYGNTNNEMINSAIILNGIAHLRLGDHNLIFTNVLSGPGGFLMEYWNHQMILSASNTYAGPTIINQGGNTLSLALSGNGSISHSSLIFFGGSDPTSVRMDVSGRNDQTFTLANGQTLAGVGAVNGQLVVSAGATISPSGTNVTLGVTAGSNATGAISASGNITLNGITVIKLKGSGTNDAIQTQGNLQFGGALTLANINASPLSAGNSFQIFNAAGYSGVFTSTNLPSLDAGLAWDLSQLNSGLVKVIGNNVGPVIGTTTIAGGKLIFSGTGGTANGTYYVLTTTNLTAPLAEWVSVQTNAYDASGAFSVTNPVNASTPQLFYRIQQP